MKKIISIVFAGVFYSFSWAQVVPPPLNCIAPYDGPMPVDVPFGPPFYTINGPEDYYFEDIDATAHGGVRTLGSVHAIFLNRQPETSTIRFTRWGIDWQNHPTWSAGIWPYYGQQLTDDTNISLAFDYWPDYRNRSEWIDGTGEFVFAGQWRSFEYNIGLRQFQQGVNWLLTRSDGEYIVPTEAETEAGFRFKLFPEQGVLRCIRPDGRVFDWFPDLARFKNPISTIEWVGDPFIVIADGGTALVLYKTVALGRRDGSGELTYFGNPFSSNNRRWLVSWFMVHWHNNRDGDSGIEVIPGDSNRDGIVTVGDFFFYLNYFFDASPQADVDGVPGVTVADFFAYLNDMLPRIGVVSNPSVPAPCAGTEHCTCG